MKLQKLRITLEPYGLYPKGTGLVIDVEVGGREAIRIKRIMPENNFESYFDYIWNECKNLIDAEISGLEEEE